MQLKTSFGIGNRTQSGVFYAHIGKRYGSFLVIQFVNIANNNNRLNLSNADLTNKTKGKEEYGKWGFHLRNWEWLFHNFSVFYGNICIF